MSDEVLKRHQAAHQMVVELCLGRKHWTMSVPARPEHDPDLVIDNSLKDIPALVAKVTALEAELSEAKEEIKSLEEVESNWESDFHKFLDSIRVPRSSQGLAGACDGSYARVEAELTRLREVETAGDELLKCSQAAREKLDPEMRRTRLTVALWKAENFYADARRLLPQNPSASIIVELSRQRAVKKAMDELLTACRTLDLTQISQKADALEAAKGAK